MFDFFNDKEKPPEEASAAPEPALTPFQQQVDAIRSAWKEDNPLKAFDALKKIDSCDLGGVVNEINRATQEDPELFRMQRKWYRGSVQELNDDQIRFDIVRLTPQGGFATTELSIISNKCKK